jgi:hypothetical protein
MSRGLGKVERFILDVLRSHQQHTDFYSRWLSAYAIAHFRVCSGPLEYVRRFAAMGRSRKNEWQCKRCGGPDEISAAEAESLRRAIRTLAKAGLVEVEHYPVLRSRLPLTADEKERENKELEQCVNAVGKLLSRLPHRRFRRRRVQSE